jgi:hypothetical protein
MVRRHAFGELDGQRLTRLELALGNGQMDLVDRFFVESLTRRRRVPGEASSIAVVDRGDLESREFLDARRRDALGMTRTEEPEEFLEEFRNQVHHVEPSR